MLSKVPEEPPVCAREQILASHQFIVAQFNILQVAAGLIDRLYHPLPNLDISGLIVAQFAISQVAAGLTDRLCHPLPNLGILGFVVAQIERSQVALLSL